MRTVPETTEQVAFLLDPPDAHHPSPQSTRTLLFHNHAHTTRTTPHAVVVHDEEVCLQPTTRTVCYNYIFVFVKRIVQSLLVDSRGYVE
jgi:hypothetical protein